MAGLAPLIAVAASMAASMVESATVPLGAVRGAEPVALAQRILPPETAARIEGGFVRRQWLPGQSYFIRFDERPSVHSDGLCRRTSHVASAGAPRVGEEAADDTPLALTPFQTVVFYAPTYPNLASDAGCLSEGGWIGAPERELEPTLRMLDRLTRAMARAAGPDELGFALSCRSDKPEDCADPRRALADLPLDRLLGVRLKNTVYQEEPTEGRVRVRKMQPVVDDRWPEAEVHFDSTPPDGQSWIVVLKGIDRLEAVEIRRTLVIRH